MNPNEKSAHLLRRFGLGASPGEMAAATKAGFEATLVRLLDPRYPAERVHPLRFTVRKDEPPEVASYLLRLHWVYHFLTTETPLREKLALFWHDHFAVDDENGGDGLMMLSYVELLRRDPLGKFGDLLEQIAKNPAFMEMLTMQNSTRVKPNENFARELLELYTLGVGHYTERDIQESARAFTGWTYLNRFWERQEVPMERRLQQLVDSGMNYAGFAFVPEFHDTGVKEILGEKRAFSGEELLEMIASREACAEFITKKLWEFFAYPEPEKAVHQALTQTYRKTDGSIRAVLETLARRPEFYSDRCMRQRIKSPVEYVVAICRALGSATLLPPRIGLDRPHDEAIPEEGASILGGMAYWMSQCGQLLLRPPSVAGWEWGPGWVSTSNMVWRQKFDGMLTWEPKDKEKKVWGPAPGGQVMIRYFRERDPKSPDALVSILLRFFDCALGAEAHQALVDTCQKNGAMQPYDSGNDNWFFGQIWHLYFLLRAAPEFHLC